MKPSDFLTRHPVFTRAEFERALGERGPRSPRTVTSHLVRWQREGRIRKLKAGLYVGAAAPGLGSPDPYAVAARMAPDAELAYHTALELHGHAQSVFSTLTFTTWSKVKPLAFAAHRFRPVRPRAALRKPAPQGRWSVRLERPGGPLLVTSLERTVVDCLDRPDLAGGLEEVWRSLAGVRALDLPVLMAYFERLARPLLAARLGYYLEGRAEDLLVSRRHLASLRERRPRSPVSFDRRRPGRFVPAWNLVVPPEFTRASRESGDADS